MIIGGRMLESKYKGMITPFRSQYEMEGLTGGVGPAGYDVALDLPIVNSHDLWISPDRFLLAATFERFVMPLDIMGIVHDKSTLARKGLAVQNTVIEPGWEGYLTLELTNHGNSPVMLIQGQPIAQVVFHQVLGAIPYTGKYQNQEQGPQASR